jgi:superfamily II RNA helicase
MTIVEQPKTTAQCIQVSGRVGRRPQDSPGLVITIYGAARPRDRSHYERFRTYHQSLYAQVEPTSVTPFAAPVRSCGGRCTP